VTDAPPPRLLIVALPAPSRDAALAVLRGIAGDDEVRIATDAALIVHTAAEPSAIRDAVARALPPGAAIFEAEFERWSATDADATWLWRRGH
jgi:hypothetical protein